MLCLGQADRSPARGLAHDLLELGRCTGTVFAVVLDDTSRLRGEGDDRRLIGLADLPLEPTELLRCRESASRVGQLVGEWIVEIRIGKCQRGVVVVDSCRQSRPVQHDDPRAGRCVGGDAVDRLDLRPGLDHGRPQREIRVGACQRRSDDSECARPCDEGAASTGTETVKSRNNMRCDEQSAAEQRVQVHAEDRLAAVALAEKQRERREGDDRTRDHVRPLVFPAHHRGERGEQQHACRQRSTYERRDLLRGHSGSGHVAGCVADRIAAGQDSVRGNGFEVECQVRTRDTDHRRDRPPRARLTEDDERYCRRKCPERCELMCGDDRGERDDGKNARLPVMP